MARKGELAKEKAMSIITKAFGENFVATQDKKIYVNVEENGEKIQFAISLTQPKTTINISNTVDEKLFTGKDGNEGFPLKEPSPDREEQKRIQEENVRKLKERLGL